MPFIFSKGFSGNQNAKESENFLWDMEQFGRLPRPCAQHVGNLTRPRAQQAGHTPRPRAQHAGHAHRQCTQHAGSAHNMQAVDPGCMDQRLDMALHGDCWADGGLKIQMGY